MLLADIVVVGGLILFVVAMVVVANSGPRDIPFDSEKWRAETGRSSTCSGLFSSSDRRRMSGDLARILLTTVPRPGKQQVERMLGQPNAYKTDESWSYWAGASTMDCVTFTVTFDESGAVVSARSSKP